MTAIIDGKDEVISQLQKRNSELENYLANYVPVLPTAYQISVHNYSRWLYEIVRHALASALRRGGVLPYKKLMGMYR